MVLKCDQDSGRVVLIDLCKWTRGKGRIREGKLVARTHAGSGIVRGDRPVGPVDFAAQNLVYDIACEASIMGAIPQAMQFCARICMESKNYKLF
mgnify:CR=1 FL=1